MAISVLEKATILNVIEEIRKIDYHTSSLEDIKQLINPLLNGFGIVAPEFKKGIYINRIRKCKKPENIKQITYPPADKAILGRANEKGKSIFYGSVGKSVPFFELTPIVGDTVVISTWRTKEDMILNQIGFTKQTATELQSLRDYEKEHEFIKRMSSFGETNLMIYNFLASCFVRKIPEGEPEFYKLTVTIANWLMSGEIFAGILYPTVKMFGNADNVALKPEFVDRAMELISIEFAEITDKTQDNFNIEILDSATSWDAKGNINWSGRMLGWTFPMPLQKKIEFEGSEWITRDDNKSRIDPVPTTPIDINPSPTLFKYLKSYPSNFRLKADMPVTIQSHTVNIRADIQYDFEANERFVTFYIPHCEIPFDIAASLSNSYDNFYKLEDHFQAEIILKNKLDPTKAVSSHGMKDKKLIHIFSEDYIDAQELGKNVVAGFILKMDCGSPPPLTFNYIYKPTQK